MQDEAHEQHPYEQDDALNDRLYNVARKVDKILHREPVENHAAILGMIQVSTQRRMHEHQAQQQHKAAALAADAQRKAQGAVWGAVNVASYSWMASGVRKLVDHPETSPQLHHQRIAALRGLRVHRNIFRRHRKSV